MVVYVSPSSIAYLKQNDLTKLEIFPRPLLHLQQSFESRSKQQQNAKIKCWFESAKVSVKRWDICGRLLLRIFVLCHDTVFHLIELKAEKETYSVLYNKLLYREDVFAFSFYTLLFALCACALPSSTTKHCTGWKYSSSRWHCHCSHTFNVLCCLLFFFVSFCLLLSMPYSYL